MWEFSLNIKTENLELANKAKKMLSQYFEVISGLVTTHQDEDYISILVASQEERKELSKRAIISVVVDVICNDFKETFLEKYLFLPSGDKIGMFAFKKALLNFDRETDKYIVRKMLNVEHDLYLESFYHFKLQSLQNKWAELVSLANENRDYLLSNESFIDLLKFLVDNLDICEDEISIVKEDGGYRIYTEDNSYANSLLNEENVVPSVIDLSPQKINLYFNETSNAIDLLEQIFEERITKNNLSFQNIKKFKLN